MVREIVTIDEELCTGCGDCVPNCHEGALQIIDGKARLISDLMCDGLGACIGHCPTGAITIEKREAEPYNETKVIEQMISKGRNTVVAHLKHLKEHQEFDFLHEAVRYLRANQATIPFSVADVTSEVHNSVPGHAHANGHGHSHAQPHAHAHGHGGGSCPSSREISFAPQQMRPDFGAPVAQTQTELRQWPVQMHLINPQASYFQKSDVLIAADCVPFAVAGFHQNFLKGKSLAIACPKLDEGLDVYREKIKKMIDLAQVNTITVMIMQVPCCGGLLQLVKQAASQATRRVPIKSIVVSLQGEVLAEEWV